MNVNDLPERLRSKIEVQGDGCWLWIAYCTRDGYGRVRVGETVKYAHRVVYEYLKDEIPSGLTLDHLCRTRHCVNPNHLDPVTSGINTMRGRTIVAANAARTHCTNGHEFTPDNTYLRVSRYGTTWRQCRRCQYLASAKYCASRRATSIISGVSGG